MKNLRQMLQKDTTFSDNTRMELESVLKRTRMEQGGLSLIEVAEAICDALEEEAPMVANNILKEVELRIEVGRLSVNNN